MEEICLVVITDMLALSWDAIDSLDIGVQLQFYQIKSLGNRKKIFGQKVRGEKSSVERRLRSAVQSLYTAVEIRQVPNNPVISLNIMDLTCVLEIKTY